MPRKAAFGARKHRLIRTPRPAAKPSALVVAECLLDLFAGVHHKRPILHNRLTDRASLQKQELALFRAIFKTNLDFPVELHQSVPGQRFAADLDGTAAEEIDGPVSAWPGRGYCPSRTWRHFYRPHGDGAIRLRRP